MSQDLDVVQKKMKLHTNELYRIQNMLTKLNIYKGLNNGLYRREKDQAKAQGKIFEEYRLQIKDSEMQRHQSDYKLNTQNNSFISDASIVLAKGVKEIKRIASSRNNINFYLKPSFGKEAPINVSLKLGKEFELRMNQNLVKYTNPQKSNNSVQPFSLTNLYDKNLNFINQVQSINPLNNEQKASRRKILTAKLNNIQI